MVLDSGLIAFEDFYEFNGYQGCRAFPSSRLAAHDIATRSTH
jgi:hypothetical protein